MMFDTFDRTGEAEFPFPKKVVFRALVNAVTTLRGMDIENKDELATRLDIKTGMSAFSWGEKVAVSVSEKSPSTATISVQSGAKTIFGSGTTHGKNRENVKLIINQTSKILSEHGSAWCEELGIDMNTSPVAVGTSTLSVADELMKLALLRDQGVLTLDEFATQKARILGS